MLKFLAELFPVVLGDASFDSPEIIDRAHCTLTPRPAREDRPRPHYYAHKQKILDLGKAKGRLTYKGAQVHIFPNMSLEVSRLRAVSNTVKRKLPDNNITYSLFYPAKLTITMDGTRCTFDSPHAAKDLFNQTCGLISIQVTLKDTV